MKNITTTGITNAIGFIIAATLIICCSEDPATCELNNSGTVEFENTRNNGVLQIFFDKSRISVNGSGDLNIPPGEKASSDLPVGEHNIKVRLLISNCSGNRCQVSSSMLSDSDEDIFQCQQRTFAY